VPGQEGESQEEAGHGGDGRQVARGRAGKEDPEKPLAGRRAVADLGLQEGATLGDQVVAGIGRTLIGSGVATRRGHAGARGVGHRQPGDVELGAPGAPGEILDRVPVLIAGGKVHRAEVAVGAEQIVHEADALEEVGPVQRRHHPHARDHVAHRHVHGGLVVVVELHELVGRRSQRAHLLVEPSQCGGGLGVLLAQALHEVHHEGGGQRGGFEPLEGERAAGPSAEPEQLVGQRVGPEPRRAALHDSLGQAPQVLDEHEPQGDRDGPELADRQGLDPLEAADEALKRLRLEAAVGVCDVLPGHPEHAGISLKRLLRELRELAVESAREILAHLPQHLVRDVEVVDEPLRGRSDGAFLPDHRGDLSIALQQDPAAVAQARRDTVTACAVGQDRPARETLRKLFEPLGAQELGANGILGLAGRR
jgi:hypothetical protein